MLSTIPETIERWAERAPKKRAIFALNREPISYEELVRQALHVCGVLRENGMTPRHRVALSIQDKPSMAICFVGTLFHRAIAVPVNPSGTFDEIKSYLAETNVSALLTDTETNSTVVRAAQMLGLTVIALEPEKKKIGVRFNTDSPVKMTPQGWPIPSDISYFISTSGTTGRKIVPRTHEEVTWNFQRKNKTVIKIHSSDLCINPVPLYFNHSLEGSVLASLLAGGGVILCSTTDITEFFECCDRYEPTWMLAGKTFIQAVLSKASQYTAIIRNSHLSFVHSGGAAFENTIISEFELLFNTRLVNCYAMTEVSTIACPPLPPMEMKPGTVGVPMVAQIDIVDDNGVSVRRGDVGEIVVRDPGVMKGYIDNPEANFEAFRDGWFRTGDIGMMDSDGFLTLCGRSKDIISRGGEKISPQEIEDIILKNPAVQQACVFGVPHPTLTEIIGAALVLVPGKTIGKSEIANFLRERMSPSKVPVVWMFLDELPMTATGKLRRNELNDIYQDSQVANLPN